MKIGIIGAGNIGGSLGKVWAAKGHEVVFGARDPNSEKTQKALEAIDKAKVMSIADAAAFADVIAIAVPGNALKETVQSLGNISGKVVIDATNRIGPPGSDDGPSAAQDIARWSQGAKVVKAFNTMGWETLINPVFSGQPATAFLAGDDAEAKATVTHLAQEIGLQAVDAGPLANAVSVEAVARLWVYMMRNGLGRDFAFGMIRR